MRQYQVPLLARLCAALQVEGHVEELWLPGRAPEGHALDLDAAIQEIVATGEYLGTRPGSASRHRSWFPAITTLCRCGRPRENSPNDLASAASPSLQKSPAWTSTSPAGMLISLCRPWVSLRRTSLWGKHPPDRASTAVWTALTRWSTAPGSHPAGLGHDLHALLADALEFARTTGVFGDFLARITSRGVLPGDDQA